MGISESTAEIMTSREGDLRVWRTGWLGRRRYAIRSEADWAALVSYARGSGWLLMLFVMITPALLVLLDDRRLALSASFLLTVVLLLLSLQQHRRLSRSLGPPLDK